MICSITSTSTSMFCFASSTYSGSIKSPQKWRITQRKGGRGSGKGGHQEKGERNGKYDIKKKSRVWFSKKRLLADTIKPISIFSSSKTIYIQPATALTSASYQQSQDNLGSMSIYSFSPTEKTLENANN